jgi:ABC-2 type transport system ATP-binding protein
MTGRELLELVAALVGVSRADVPARVDATLERVGLADAAGRRISGYSGGMRQRLGIGQALIGEPDLLILDEPVSSLDPEGRRDLLELIGELRESATVVFSTHLLADVERVCDRVAILDQGRLVIESTIDDLLHRFAPPVYVIEIDPGPGPAGDGSALAGLAARLEREPWVGELSVTGSIARVAVTDDARASKELLAAIVETGLPISAFRRERPSLEDVFLQLVGRDA